MFIYFLESGVLKNGIQEVVGSIPSSSTTYFKRLSIVLDNLFFLGVIRRTISVLRGFDLQLLQLLVSEGLLGFGREVCVALPVYAATSPIS